MNTHPTQSPDFIFFGIKRGIYGEVIPPPLYYGIKPEEAIDALATAVRNTTGEELYRPTKGKSRAGLERLAALYVHQRRFTQALAGEVNEPAAMAVRILLEEGNEPLSLRPLFLDELHHLSFVPVLQREAGDSWRIGMADHGRVFRFTAVSGAEAYAVAQEVYTKWVEEEATTWRQQVGHLAKTVTPNETTTLWEVALTGKNRVRITPAYCLERWGGHGHYALWLPNKQFFAFSARSHLEATVYTQIMLRQKKDLILPPVSPTQLQASIKAVLPEINQSGPSGFVCGEMMADVTEQHIILHRRTASQVHSVGYVQQRNGVIGLYQQQTARKSPKLKRQLALPAAWEQKERLRISILWAFFSLL